MWATSPIEKIETDQKRMCSYKDGIYQVNNFESSDQFITEWSWPNETVSQVIKRKGSLYFVYLRYRYYSDYAKQYQPEIAMYQYICKEDNFILLTDRSFWLESWTITKAEIDMVDNRFIVARAYASSTKNYFHVIHDRQLKTDIYLDTNFIHNFNTILDFKPQKTGVWKVLIRLANMDTKWMQYNLIDKKIY